jgi:hypothetical protein
LPPLIADSKVPAAAGVTQNELTVPLPVLWQSAFVEQLPVVVETAVQ